MYFLSSGVNGLTVHSPQYDLPGFVCGSSSVRLSEVGGGSGEAALDKGVLRS